MSFERDYLGSKLLPLQAASQISPAKWLIEETFEGPAPFTSAHKTEFGTTHAFSVVATPAYQGNRSARFELRDTDPMISNGTRAEATIVKDAVEKEMWYAFAVYFPADGFIKDSQPEIISQWWQRADKHLGEVNTSPATALQIKNDRFILYTGFNAEQISQGINKESRRKIDLGEVTKDSWHQFVFHFIHSYGADGLVEVWHNGNKVLTHPGGNMYNNVAMPKWKIGIYKWKWNGNDTTDTRKRILYFDNIKVGNEKVSFMDMAPDNDPPPANDPTPNAIESLTFVNSHTDQDIKKVVDGDTLRLRALGTNKISIRANTNAAKTGCVKFALSGGMEYSYADKLMPYALFGDDGKGNYHYGNYLLEGSYTLVVTPYSDTKAKGIPGEPYLVNFTIAN
jgi:hypothetical protein